MLTDIIEIIAKYDPETEKLLRNSHSINSAINTIFTKTCSITPTAKQTQSKINKKSSFAKEDLLTRFKT